MNKILGSKIKKFRQEKGISRENLSTTLGISIHTLSKYEQGQREPNIETLAKIANALGVTINDLAGQEDTITKKVLDHLASGISLDEMSKDINISIDRLKSLLNNNAKDITFSEIKKIGKYIGFSDEKIAEWVALDGLTDLIYNDKNKSDFDIEMLKKVFLNKKNNKKEIDDILNKSENIINAMKGIKFEDVICNDREHLLFGFKCLLTNYTIDWHKFTDDELMEIINSGTMFKFFPKIAKTYYDFFKNRNEASTVKIDLPEDK